MQSYNNFHGLKIPKTKPRPRRQESSGFWLLANGYWLLAFLSLLKRLNLSTATLIIYQMNLKHRYCLFVLSLFTLATALMAQETYAPPKLSNPDSWSIILVPDTQTYAKFERNQGTLETMTAWISENIEP